MVDPARQLVLAGRFQGAPAAVRKWTLPHSRVWTSSKKRPAKRTVHICIHIQTTHIYIYYRCMFSEVPATEWSMFWNSPEMVLPEVRERRGLDKLKALVERRAAVSRSGQRRPFRGQQLLKPEAV